ncbi:MAG: tetratricopeptide repeat protein [Myxococcota bacterium]
MAGGAGIPRGGIADLELRFAQEPESQAFIPLCEAYLEQGRLMEAMVVCRKGLKTHPKVEVAQVLLARILKAQNKLDRSLTELDKAISAHPKSAPALSLRGEVRLARGDENGAMQDFREVLELDPAQEVARRELESRGLLPAPSARKPTGAERAEPSSTLDRAPHPRAAAMDARHSFDAPTMVAPPPEFEPQHRTDFAPPTVVNRVAPQLLEADDELERLAHQHAESRPKPGRPILTIGLGVALLVVTATVVTWRFVEKSRLEAIDRLTQDAMAEFRRDAYVGYQGAARSFEEILEDYDHDHAATLGRLAHTYAIIWGEHGDADVEARMREVLTQSQNETGSTGHRTAAAALVALHDAADRHTGAQRALEVVEPVLRQQQEEGVVSPPVRLVEGIAETYRGEYTEAFEAFQSARTGSGVELRGTVWAAVAALRAGQLSTAQNLLQEALRIDRQHPGALAFMTLVKLQRGNLRGANVALEAFQAVESARPKDISFKSRALALYAQSELYRSAGEEERASLAYEEAIKLDPGNADFPYALGRSLLKAQRPRDALKPLRQALEMEPNRYAILVDLAEAEMFERQFEQAKRHIDDALEKKPNFLPALLARARLLRRTRAPNTEAFLENLLAQRPEALVEVKLELGRLYRQQNRLDLAQTTLEEALERMAARGRPLQADVLLSYGRLMEDRGNLQVAQETYAKAAEFEELEGWYRLSVAAAKAGNTSRAKKACTRYLEAGSGLKYAKNAQQICAQL